MTGNLSSGGIVGGSHRVIELGSMVSQSDRELLKHLNSKFDPDDISVTVHRNNASVLL